jgi:lambda repressor-like predicted transcriptional regulator
MNNNIEINEFVAKIKKMNFSQIQRLYTKLTNREAKTEKSERDFMSAIIIARLYELPQADFIKAIDASLKRNAELNARKFTRREEIFAIFAMREDGMSLANIAKQFAASGMFIRNILTGKLYKDLQPSASEKAKFFSATVAQLSK